jgi:acyl carrier protein
MPAIQMENTHIIEKRLKEILSAHLSIPENIIDDALSVKDVKIWKGTVHRQLLEKIETEFKMQFDPDEIDTLINFKIIKYTVISHFL